MLDFLSKEKQKTLLKYPFIREYIRGKLAKIMFLVNLKGFENQLIEDGITEHDIENLKKLKVKAALKTPKSNRKMLFAGLAVALVFMFIFGPNLFAGETEEAVGELVYKDGKAIIKKGQTVAVGKYQVSSADNAVVVYKKCPSEGLKGNSVCISDKEIMLSSDVEGSVTVEVQAGNEMFDTFKIDETGQLIPDEKDNLKITVNGGDSLQVQERKEGTKFLFFGKEEKKIPLVTHTRAENGNTTIENGRITLTLVNASLTSSNVRLLRDTDGDNMAPIILASEYQSVPFQLQSDSLEAIDKGWQIRIGSNNQYAFVSPKKVNESVVYNEYGIAISQYPDQIQTEEQLQEKWKEKNIEFRKAGVLKRSIPGAEFKPSKSQFKEIRYSTENYTEPTPFMLQLIDQWLEENPAADLDYIAFTDMDYTQSGDPSTYTAVGRFSFRNDKRGFLLGEAMLDPKTSSISYSSYTDRTLNRPLRIITHEYEHVMDQEIQERDANKLLKSADEIWQKDSELKREALDYAYNLPEEVTRKNYEVLLATTYSDNFFNTRTRKTNEANIKNYEEKKILLEKQGYKPYMKRYGIESREEVDKDIKSSKETYEKSIYENKLLNLYTKEYDYTIDITSIYVGLHGLITSEELAETSATNSMLEHEEHGEYVKKKLYELKAKDYMLSQLLKDPSNKPMQFHYNDLAENKTLKLYRDPILQDKFSKSIAILKEEKEIFDEEDKKLAEKYIKNNEKLSYRVFESLGSFNYFAQKNDRCDQSYQGMMKYIENESGLPATYATHSKREKISIKTILSPSRSRYYELSSTHREESIEERKRKLHNGTSAQKKFYRILTQLAFDAGKMPVKEFKQVMGEDYCAKPDCIDKKCCIYKLNCVGECS